MPNVSAHLGCALKVKKELNIKDDRFLVGALLPDIIDEDKRKSHYKIRGKFYLVPNLKEYLDTHDMKDPMNLGYFFHLYLDYYYFDEFLYNEHRGIDVFKEFVIYDDYDYVNYSLVKHFDIDIPYIEKAFLDNYDPSISERKLIKNIRCLKLNKEGKCAYLDKNRFIKFLDKTTDAFIKEYRLNIKSQ